MGGLVSLLRKLWIIDDQDNNQNGTRVLDPTLPDNNSIPDPLGGASHTHHHSITDYR